MRVLLICAFTIGYVAAITFDLNKEWTLYKQKYPRNYIGNEELTAKLNFKNNRIYVDNHNYYYDRGVYTYSLAINGFSDKSLANFVKYFESADVDAALLRHAVPITPSPLPNFDFADLEFTSALKGVAELGCSSGWAFAAASVLEIFDQYESNPTIKTGPLSPQQLIDCSGLNVACTKQIPHIAFKYVIKAPTLSTAALYPYKNKQGPCIVPPQDPNHIPVNITNYSTIMDGNAEQLKKVLSYMSPVAFDFNPKSLQFMHYKQGIFVQPSGLQKGSHFMTITGYGTENNKQFWRVKNSFGDGWGENGYIRITPSSSIPKSAVFPVKN